MAPRSFYAPGGVFWFDVPAEGLRNNETRNSGPHADLPRPWVVISSRALREGIVTAVPLTTRPNTRGKQPWRIPVSSRDYEDNPPPDASLVDRWADSIARVEQLRALDIDRVQGPDGPRLAARLRRGALDQIQLAAAELVNPTR